MKWNIREVDTLTGPQADDELVGTYQSQDDAVCAAKRMQQEKWMEGDDRLEKVEEVIPGCGYLVCSTNCDFGHFVYAPKLRKEYREKMLAKENEVQVMQ